MFNNEWKTYKRWNTYLVLKLNWIIIVIITDIVLKFLEVISQTDIFSKHHTQSLHHTFNLKSRGTATWLPTMYVLVLHQELWIALSPALLGTNTVNKCIDTIFIKYFRGKYGGRGTILEFHYNYLKVFFVVIKREE